MFHNAFTLPSQPNDRSKTNVFVFPFATRSLIDQLSSESQQRSNQQRTGIRTVSLDEPVIVENNGSTAILFQNSNEEAETSERIAHHLRKELGQETSNQKVTIFVPEQIQFKALVPIINVVNSLPNTVDLCGYQGSGESVFDLIGGSRRSQRQAA